MIETGTHTMKAFTVWQPWASLIITGAKPFEFRPKSYLDRRAYRDGPDTGERIVIHAGARPVRPAEVDDLLQRLDGPDDTTGLIVDRARQLLTRLRLSHRCQGLPLGVCLGTAIIGKPRNAAAIFSGSDSDRGDFTWAWPLGQIKPFDAPIPARGSQGFWKWSPPGDIEERLAS